MISSSSLIKLKCALTSSVQQLNVSISLAAHAWAPAETDIQPACDTLQPQLLTCKTASSSSSSSAFDVLMRPSDEADSKILDEGVDDLRNSSAVISSEWVEPWVRIGADGCRGSQYSRSASSPWRSVPAATVKPSADTSKHSRERGRPALVTGENKRLLSRQNA